MESIQMIEDFFNETRSDWKKVVKDLDLQPNPAIGLYSKVESRPFTKSDFIRKPFHENLIGYDV